MNRLRVLITTNIPSPYFTEYADELQRYCDVTVLYELRCAKDRDSEWQKNCQYKHNAIFLGAKYISAESGISLKVFKYLKSGLYDRIIIANPMTPTGILECMYCRFLDIPYIVQSEGGFQGTGKGFKEKFKRFLLEKASLYLTGMGGKNDYFLVYGATMAELRPYPFSSMREEQIEHELITKEMKSKLRHDLNIDEEFVVISVGSIIYRKGFDVLIQSIQRLDFDWGLYIIGGKLSDELKQLVDSSFEDRIHSIDFLDFEGLKNYYLMSDLFVLATREDTWGLVINEAMAHGLPVITTKRCIAGECLVEDDINGYLVEVDDVDQLTDAIQNLYNNPVKRAEMSSNNLNKIQVYTIENMAKVIYAALANH